MSDDLRNMIWCTSYCNHGHRMLDGKPVAHECYVLPVAALRTEFLGNVDKASAIIAAAKPLRLHKGVRP